MKSIYLSHPWLSSGALAGLLVVCSAAVHPFGTPKQPGREGAPPSGLDLPPDMSAVVKRACIDCHSNQTVWPWYSYVAPVSWLIERDVHRGRAHMNLSEWQQYTFTQRQKLLADIASAVKNREMPLSQYTLIHRGARLSDADRNLVYNWARAERRKLRAALSCVSKSSPDGLEQTQNEIPSGQTGGPAPKPPHMSRFPAIAAGK